MKELNRLLQQLADNINEARKENQINDHLEGAESDIAEIQSLVKNLSIPVVSQQRELLLEWEKSQYIEAGWNKSKEMVAKKIDKYLANNCT